MEPYAIRRPGTERRNQYQPRCVELWSGHRGVGSTRIPVGSEIDVLIPCWPVEVWQAVDRPALRAAFDEGVWRTQTASLDRVEKSQERQLCLLGISTISAPNARWDDSVTATLHRAIITNAPAT